MKYSKNQIIEAKISETNMMGFGVVKIDGAVFFVQNGVEGDVAKLKIIKCAKNYYVCRIEELITPSEHRIEPKCPHFKACGGCSFWHVCYEHELELKRHYVENCLRREGVNALDVLRVSSTRNTMGYRNKGQYPVQRDQDGKVICGFYSPRSHKICKIDNCLIQDAAFQAINDFLCDFFQKHKIPPYREEDGTGLVRHIYLRRGKASGEISLCLVLSLSEFPRKEELIEEIRKRFPEIVSVSFNIQPRNTNVILGDETRIVYGKDKIEDVLCGRRFLISPLSFYQVNREGAELLYQTAFEMSDINQYDLIVDLYCGIGSISLSSHAKAPILGVEIVPDAVKDAEINAELNGIQTAKFICGDASDAFDLVHTSGVKNPLVIVDPPRKGLSDKLISDISKNGIKNILYISCNPETFARDISKFISLGYSVGDIQPVDMFPRTAHVECVTLISR